MTVETNSPRKPDDPALPTTKPRGKRLNGWEIASALRLWEEEKSSLHRARQSGTFDPSYNDGRESGIRSCLFMLGLITEETYRQPREPAAVGGAA